MSLPRVLIQLSAALALLASSSGCATYASLNASKPGSPKVFSGTRFDLHALRDPGAATRRFSATPPRGPALDLPFSFALDTIMLPLTVSAALMEAARL